LGVASNRALWTLTERAARYALGPCVGQACAPRRDGGRLDQDAARPIAFAAAIFGGMSGS